MGVHVERSQRLPALGNADRGRKGCTPGYCELDSKQEEVASMQDGVASIQNSEAAPCLTPRCSSRPRFADSAADRAREKNFRSRAGCSDRFHRSRSKRCMHFCRPDARARIGRARTRCAPRRSITLSSICHVSARGADRDRFSVQRRVNAGRGADHRDGRDAGEWSCWSASIGCGRCRGASHDETARRWPCRACRSRSRRCEVSVFVTLVDPRHGGARGVEPVPRVATSSLHGCVSAPTSETIGRPSSSPRRLADRRHPAHGGFVAVSPASPISRPASGWTRPQASPGPSVRGAPERGMGMAPP